MKIQVTRTLELRETTTAEIAFYERAKPMVLEEDGMKLAWVQDYDEAIQYIDENIEGSITPDADNEHITGVPDLIKLLGADDREGAERNLYKFTDCGAWIRWSGNDRHVTVGSIVEGSEAGTEEFTLLYPFPKSEWEHVIGEVERHAKMIWDWANGGDEDLATPEEQGIDFPQL